MGYDNHFLIRDGLKYFQHWTCTIIANTFEKYLNINITFKAEDITHTLNIIDSLQFLNASLGKLIEICPCKYFTETLGVSNEIKYSKGKFKFT